MSSQAVIIDDNPKNVNVLARLLSNEGLSSVQITNPAKLKVALEHAEDIKVIFVDLEMPGMDGYQILNQLKADVRFQSVPVLAYTVHVSEINVAHERGFDGFLGKPLDADNFPGQLARILSGEPVWETP